MISKILCVHISIFPHCLSHLHYNWTWTPMRWCILLNCLRNFYAFESMDHQL
uniref:Uncharacterized protein n=1 Tax=Arundo donax TaxID=35708 RepID=A0A0A8ZCW7_ARUDO